MCSRNLNDPKTYTIKLTKQATKDIQKLTLNWKPFKDILRNVIAVAPETFPHRAVVRLLPVRLTIRDRIVYRIENMESAVTIVRAKTHYGD